MNIGLIDDPGHTRITDTIGEHDQHSLSMTVRHESLRCAQCQDTVAAVLEADSVYVGTRRISEIRADIPTR
jgi:hypothetical protein